MITTGPLIRPSRRAASSCRSTGRVYSPQLSSTVCRVSSTRSLLSRAESILVEMPSDTMPSTTAKVKTPVMCSDVASSRESAFGVALQSAPGISLSSEYAW